MSYFCPDQSVATAAVFFHRSVFARAQVTDTGRPFVESCVPLFFENWYNTDLFKVC